ncbi:MAG: AAA family ATPase [Microscillaceae bacterium]|nr:AAA family ATPase [Microscillaceae bacterium]
MQSLELSPLAQLALHYVNTTRRHVFLTGKAGSGKTTLLKYIVQHTYKSVAIAAPTGIAAINAGGVSLHSLLQLPIGNFIPEERPQRATHENRRFYTPKSLLAEQKMGKEKRRLLQSLELLVIDEVSMLRADLLDGADAVLRHARQNYHQPFGGLQILFIGDLSQLPPIVRPEEWEVLSQYYPSLYFFSARALQSQSPIFVELDKIYRQSDPVFIALLNRLRDKQLIKADIDRLNQHYQAGASSLPGYIHITTHNHKADALNAEAFARLKSPVFCFEADISGDFPERLYPCLSRLELREGAQVMFLKNDTQHSPPRYFNGKIGTVAFLSEEKIGIRTEEGEMLFASPYVWENKRYTLNEATGEMEEEVLGTFIQYPLRLAWAITVHKSQGLTFEKAILDLAGSFAPGQMYVALSRLRGLAGLILSTPIPSQDRAQDPSLQAFQKSKPSPEMLRETLEKERTHYLCEMARQAFELEAWEKMLKNHLDSFDKDENRSAKQAYRDWTESQLGEFAELREVAQKFGQQIAHLARQHLPAQLAPHLSERVEKAKAYFLPRLQALSENFRQQKQLVLNQKKVKGYFQELQELDTQLSEIKKRMVKAHLLIESMARGQMPEKELLQKAAEYQAEKQAFAASQKVEKVSTQAQTLHLYQAGKSPQEIAEARQLSLQTIEGHLAHWVEKGELPATAFLAEADLERIGKALQELKTERLTDLKAHFEAAEGYDFGPLRLALAHWRWKNKKQTE